MQIKKIKITNFKSIYGTQEFDFEELKGLIKLSGSIGAGKTTIAEALLYGLYGNVTVRYIDDEGHYCLITLSQDLWTEHFRYNYIDRIDEVLLHGEVSARGSLTYMHKFPYFVLFTTKTEAYEYIDEYKRNHDLIKHKEKLTRINKDIEILLNEKERLESLIANYENNN